MVEKDATIADLRKLADELQSLKANLEETLEKLRCQFFGISSEKASAASISIAPSSIGKTPEDEPKRLEVKSYTRERKAKSRGKDLYANLLVKEVFPSLTDEQKICEYCNAEMSLIGYTEVRQELRI